MTVTGESWLGLRHLEPFEAQSRQSKTDQYKDIDKEKTDLKRGQLGDEGQ
jgi:hypothetical protein